MRACASVKYYNYVHLMAVYFIKRLIYLKCGITAQHIPFTLSHQYYPLHPIIPLRLLCILVEISLQQRSIRFYHSNINLLRFHQVIIVALPRCVDTGAKYSIMALKYLTE